MNLKGQIVIHKVYGEGIVIDHGDKYITVSFQQKETKFSYPDSFKGFLKAKDLTVDNAINQELMATEKQAAQMQKEQEELARQRTLAQPPVHAEIIKSKAPKKIKTKKVITRYNIAFKCNYCDGGKSPEQIGYNGICSDSIIHNNIDVEKRAWCSDTDCACRQYHDGEITRSELEETMSDLDYPCYESQMLRDWQAFAGFILSGENKRKPNKLLSVQPYSLCILTTRDPDAGDESKRYIFAAFLIDDTYEGSNRDEGYVTTSSKYKIKMSPEEAHAMPFWKYHANGNKPHKTTWGQGLFRYFGDEEAAFILRDIAVIKQRTKDESLANEFYKYFCQKININVSLLAEPKGALSIR